jgi:hypothetical protein
MVLMDQRENEREAIKQEIANRLAALTPPWPSRKTYAKKFFKRKCSDGKWLWRHLTPNEIGEAETMALELRRRNMARVLVEIDQALFSQALGGDVAAIKLAYEKFEGHGSVHTHKFENLQKTLSDILNSGTIPGNDDDS